MPTPRARSSYDRPRWNTEDAREVIAALDRSGKPVSVFAALLRRRTLWSRRDAPALREIACLFRDGLADHTGRLDHGLIAT
jgi:hypothetical protein